MRIVFMGTSSFAVPALNALHLNHDVVGVVTQPDRQSGRGRKVVHSPVKQAALQAGLNVFQPEKVKSDDFIQLMKNLSPDLNVVASFGQIIPQSVLDIPKYGNINIHASLLPKYRGAAPIQYALFNGDSVTGVTTMLMDSGLDTGPMLLKKEIKIDADDDNNSLEQKLADCGAELIIQTIDLYVHNKIVPQPQNNALSTYASSIKREDCRIIWSESAVAIANKIRGCAPKPGAFSVINGMFVKIYKAKAFNNESVHKPGLVTDVNSDGIVVDTGDGLLLLMEVQPENRNKISAAEFARGYNIKINSQFSE